MTLPLALQHHQAGRLVEARAIYQQLLAQDPNCADALHLLGVLLHQTGQTADGLALIDRAITLNPHAAPYHTNRGTLLDALRRTDEAMDAWQCALQLDPNASDALGNLGRAAFTRSQYELARSCWEHLAALRPYHPDSHNNLGVLAAQLNQLPAAAQLFQRALALNPNHAGAIRNLATTQHQLGQNEDALTTAHRVLAIEPNSAPNHKLLGDILEALHRMPEAEAAQRHALALDPTFHDAANALAGILKDIGRLEEAEPLYRQAYAASPTAERLSNIATLRQELGHFEEALQTLDRCLKMDLAHSGLHLNRGVLLLLLGRLEEAWPEYEHRLLCPQLKFLLRDFSQPRWTGQPLAGQRLLLYGEQGFGDAIHFLRYIPLVAALNPAAIYVECLPNLAPLFRGLPGITTVIPKGSALPVFDTHASLLSLPHLMRTTLATIPGTTPYLTPPPAKVGEWQIRLAAALKIQKAEITNRRIGLVWAGNPRNANEWKRTLPLDAFRDLFGIPDVTFVSLQKGEPAKQIAETQLPLIDLTDAMQDFADTAVLIDQLDLVIGVDTSVIHLAGALGKPTWLLLPFVPDWRWLLSRPDSPWYPTMRLFRQPALRDWATPLGLVRQALQAQTWL